MQKLCIVQKQIRLLIAITRSLPQAQQTSFASLKRQLPPGRSLLDSLLKVSTFKWDRVLFPNKNLFERVKSLMPSVSRRIRSTPRTTTHTTPNLTGRNDHTGKKFSLSRFSIRQRTIDRKLTRAVSARVFSHLFIFAFNDSPCMGAFTF